MGTAALFKGPEALYVQPYGRLIDCDGPRLVPCHERTLSVGALMAIRLAERFTSILQILAKMAIDYLIWSHLTLTNQTIYWSYSSNKSAEC